MTSEDHTARDPHRADLVCGECGGSIANAHRNWDFCPHCHEALSVVSAGESDD